MVSCRCWAPGCAVIGCSEFCVCFTSTRFLEAASCRGVNCHRSMAFTQAPCCTRRRDGLVWVWPPPPPCAQCPLCSSLIKWQIPSPAARWPRSGRTNRRYEEEPGPWNKHNSERSKLLLRLTRHSRGGALHVKENHPQTAGLCWALQTKERAKKLHTSTYPLSLACTSAPCCSNSCTVFTRL